ncbi:MAG TPA: hypothetical protein VIR57_09270, partial [Chloroflexota bacterium]
DTPLAASRLRASGVSALAPVANFGDLASPEQFRRTQGATGQVTPEPEKPAPREELISKDATRNRLFEAKRRAQEKRKA